MHLRTRLIRLLLLRAIGRGEQDVAGKMAVELGITRQAVNRHLAALEKEGAIISSGRTKSKKYLLGKFEFVVPVLINKKSEEHVIWNSTFDDLIADLPDNIIRIFNHGAMEMINNVIDHSGSEYMSLRINRREGGTEITIIDFGIGIFEKIKDSFNLESESEALFQLTKGKLTTDPTKHSGEGIFFTSRACDSFIIKSGKIAFSHKSGRASDFVLEDEVGSKGTLVHMAMENDSATVLSDVFNEYSTDLESFDITRIPVGLAKLGTDNLVSRSQARRVLSGSEKFKRIGFDFSGVDTIGQAFADEIFRVFAKSNPDIELIDMNANDNVRRMIARARSQT